MSDDSKIVLTSSLYLSQYINTRIRLVLKSNKYYEGVFYRSDKSMNIHLKDAVEVSLLDEECKIECKDIIINSGLLAYIEFLI